MSKIGIKQNKFKLLANIVSIASPIVVALLLFLKWDTAFSYEFNKRSFSIKIFSIFL